MKKLNITKEQFNRSRYFQRKYGKLEYVSESGKLFKTNKGNVLKFNENIHRPDVEDLDVPVTEEEEVLAQYIEERIAEEFGIGCSCDTHNPGEEMHLEIFIGEDEYDEDTDLNELCADLEELVNQIGKQEKYDSGTEWGDASFSPQGDYIYGEVWPLEGEYAINPKGELAKESTRRKRRSARRFNEGRDPDFDDEGHLDADEDNPKFSIGDKVIWNDSLWKVVDCWYDSIEGSNLYDLKGLDTREETSDVPGDELCTHDGGIAYESNRKFGKKFNESADQTLEDIIDNIVTLSILSRDAESAEEMFQDLKQELSNMGLLSGQIHEDFDDFHDIAIDFAENHNFNKQFVEQAAVTLKSEIEQGLSRGEFGESTRRARRSARRFNESDERKECRRNILKAYDSLEQAIRDYGSILEGRQCKQASKVEAKIHDIIAGFLADTSNSQGWVET